MLSHTFSQPRQTYSRISGANFFVVVNFFTVLQSFFRLIFVTLFLENAV